MIFELVTDFSAALAAMPREHPKHRMLELLEEAVRRDVHFIDRHPTTLFQCLWNTCWWYDCPEAAKHYEVPEDGWPLGEPPWEQPTASLSPLLDLWAANKRTVTPGFLWVRSMRPPPVHLGFGQAMILRAHLGAVWSARFSPDDELIVSVGEDETIRVWNSITGRQVRCIRAGPLPVLAVAFFPHPSIIRAVVSGSSYGEVRMWDCETGKCIRDFGRHEDSVHGVAFSPEGRKLASASSDTTVRIWDVDTGEEVGRLRGHADRVAGVDFSRSGDWIVTGSFDRTIRLWDARTGREVRCIQGHEGEIASVAFFPDSRRIVSGSFDGTVRIWDVLNSRQIMCCRGHTDRVWAASCSPDGTCIASGSADGSVRLWDAGNGSEICRLVGHEEWVLGVSFSNDGRFLVSAADDQTIRLWNATARGIPRRLRGGDRVTVTICSRDRRLVLGTGDGGGGVWDAETGETVDGSQWEAAQGLPVSGPPARTFSVQAAEYLSAVETPIKSCSVGREVGWFPVPLKGVEACGSSGRSWAAEGLGLYLIRLEGEFS
jgi:WD40 repeat protein